MLSFTWGGAALAQPQRVFRPAYPEPSTYVQPVLASQTPLTTSQLRRIDGQAVRLVDSARELSLEVSEHFRGERHSAKLASDTSQLVELAEQLHLELHRSNYGRVDMVRLRESSNEFIEVVARLPRTIGLLDRHPQHPYAHQGVAHMMSAYRDAHTIAMEIDRYLMVDTHIVDRQADRVAKAVEELHLEFHEHFEGYELSSRIEREIVRLSQTAEHIHEIAHQQAWSSWQMAHIERDVQELREATRQVEWLINQQARRGIRSADWDGVEHSLDAITDIHASAYLLEHMVAKYQASLGPYDPYERTVEPRRPRRDLHDGHAH
jgi:hypothetical protein